jgi:hypothetical protein
MNPDPSGRERRRRRGLLFTVTPIVATVLIVVAMAAVLVHNLHKPSTSADPSTFGTTTIPGSAQALTTTTTPTTPPPPTTTTTPDNPALAAAAVQYVDHLHISGVQFGIAILDRTTGQETLGQAGATGFYSASVIKLFVVVDLLHEAEQGAVTLDSDDQYDIKRALELSDDNAMDSLWESFDGPKLVTQMIGLAGLQDTVLDTSDSGEWGETKISARDVLAVYQYALTKLSPSDMNLVIGDLHNAANNGADGFDQAFGLLEPPRQSTVKAKQGWMIAGSEMILNTTGVLGSKNQYLVAIMSKQSAGIGYANGRNNVNEAGQLVQKALAPATD